MPLSAGSKLGPYEIVSPLGAGGMGEVYRARDTRLDRTVAIKVLNSALVASPDLKARFEREARTISQLNHPNICVLHDIGYDGDVDFLVMEFIEGESLAERLKKGALPLPELIKIGCEIADALDKAHRAGIVHRDLKPGNVMLSKTGAKLLDFGLAKPTAVGAAASSGSAPLLSAAMTMTSPSPQHSPLTQQGALVGTVQYMSPEQIQGIEADARSDIFAFGTVLYEMATGKRAFEGKSQIKVASAILEDEPQPVSAVQCTTPATLERLITTCLAKNPDERFQSALDVKLELRWVAQAPARPRDVPPKWRYRERMAWAVATLIALAAVAGYELTRQPQASPIAAAIIPPAGVAPNTAGKNGPPQLSPDGTKIAFVGCGTAVAATSLVGGRGCVIWVRALASSVAHKVEGTDGGYYPFWSPDSRELAFFADGKLKRTAADGGPVQVLCDAEDSRGGSWGKRGTILFTATRGSPIFRVPAEGGTPVAITRAADPSSLGEAGSHRWPYFLPDGEHFLYLSANTGSCAPDNKIHINTLDGKNDRVVMKTCSSVAFVAGRLLYWRDGNLVAQPFDPASGTLSGTPAAIAAHVGSDTLFSRAQFSASDDGKIAYISGDEGSRDELLWYDRDGKMLGTLGPNQSYDSVVISPDGKSVAYNGLDEPGVWLLDSRGTKTRLTHNGAASSPAWSADGKRLYFTASRNGRYDIYAVPADGSGQEQLVLSANDIPGTLGAAQLSASLSGRYLAFVTSSSTTKLDIHALPLDGPAKPRPVLQSPANETMPALSPDGNWLAYQSDESGRFDVYVTAFPGGGAQLQVSTSGGEKPVWRRDGKEIYYRAPDLRLTAVEVTNEVGTLRFGSPKALFEMPLRNLNGHSYDVAPNGHFLSNSSLSTQAQTIELLVNWPAELKK
jgi:eukaryotic-like serine/threonine-protein kinase